jgi:hypothetical protein
MIEIMGKPNDNPKDVLEFIKGLPEQEQEIAIRAAAAMGRLGNDI